MQRCEIRTRPWQSFRAFIRLFGWKYSLFFPCTLLFQYWFCQQKLIPKEPQFKVKRDLIVRTTKKKRKNPYGRQRWPESLFQTPTLLLFQNFWIRVQLFLKFENPTPVQTPATIIEPTVIYPCFYLRNDRTDSCYCRNGKVTPGPLFYKFSTRGPDPGPKEKRRILPESTPVIRIRSHLWWKAIWKTLKK